MAVVYVIANLFLIDQNAVIVRYNKFPNLGVYHANFPNLKSPWAPSQNCKKKSQGDIVFAFQFCMVHSVWFCPSLRVDILWAQLLLHFYSDYFEILQIPF